MGCLTTFHPSPVVMRYGSVSKGNEFPLYDGLVQPQKHDDLGVDPLLLHVEQLTLSGTLSWFTAFSCDSDCFCSLWCIWNKFLIFSLLQCITKDLQYIASRFFKRLIRSWCCNPWTVWVAGCIKMKVISFSVLWHSIHTHALQLSLRKFVLMGNRTSHGRAGDTLFPPVRTN